MFGRRFWGGRFFGPRYWGDGGTAAPETPSSPGGRIVGGTFSRGKWRRLREEMVAEKRLEAEETERKKSQEGASEEKRREKEIIASVFSDIKGGRMDMYLRNRCEEAGRPTPHGTEFAKVMGAIKSKVIELKDREPATIRTAIDELVKEMISRF